MKVIRFPLEMTDGVKINTIEELRQHFDLEKVLEYYYNNKLIKWLEARGYKSEVDQISILDNTYLKFNTRLKDIIFGNFNLIESVNKEQKYMEDILKIKEKNPQICTEISDWLKKSTEDLSGLMKAFDNICNEREITDLSTLKLLYEKLKDMYDKQTKAEFTIVNKIKHCFDNELESNRFFIDCGKDRLPSQYCGKYYEFDNSYFPEKWRELDVADQIPTIYNFINSINTYKNNKFGSNSTYIHSLGYEMRDSDGNCIYNPNNLSNKGKAFFYCRLCLLYLEEIDENIGIYSALLIRLDQNLNL